MIRHFAALLPATILFGLGLPVNAQDIANANEPDPLTTRAAESRFVGSDLDGGTRIEGQENGDAAEDAARDLKIYPERFPDFFDTRDDAGDIEFPGYFYPASGLAPTGLNDLDDTFEDDNLDDDYELERDEELDPRLEAIELTGDENLVETVIDGDALEEDIDIADERNVPFDDSDDLSDNDNEVDDDDLGASPEEHVRPQEMSDAERYVEGLEKRDSLIADERHDNVNTVDEAEVLDNVNPSETPGLRRDDDYDLDTEAELDMEQDADYVEDEPQIPEFEPSPIVIENPEVERDARLDRIDDSALIPLDAVVKSALMEDATDDEPVLNVDEEDIEEIEVEVESELDLLDDES